MSEFIPGTAIVVVVVVSQPAVAAVEVLDSSGCGSVLGEAHISQGTDHCYFTLLFRWQPLEGKKFRIT